MMDMGETATTAAAAVIDQIMATLGTDAVLELEGQAKRYDLTTDELVAAMAANGDSIRQTIEACGDPRYDGVRGSGTAFYAWRCRVRDGVAKATVAHAARAAACKRQQDEARWERMGVTRCDRCGGVGGCDGWTGFTCCGCGGAATV